MRNTRSILELVLILALLTFAFWLACGGCVAAEQHGMAEEAASGGVVLMPVVKAAIEFLNDAKLSAEMDILATADLAASKIETTQQAGRDAISNTSTGTPWYANLAGFIGLLYWQWRVGYRPGTWEKKAQHILSRKGSGWNREIIEGAEFRR